jgi:hypothetical protein
MMLTKGLLATACATGLIGVCWAGCSGESKDPDCVDPPKQAAEPEGKPTKVERFGLGRAGDEDKEKKDWCRACVMSKVGYASCQKVYADEPGEARDALRARARAKACSDAKFPKDQCPDSAVISLLCKGDPPPAGTTNPGTALQNLHQALSGGPLPAAAPQPAPESTPTAKDKAAAAPAASAAPADPTPATEDK